MLRERLKVKPGMTGLWQLSADRAFLIHENIEYDLYYLFNNPRFVWNACLQLAHIRSFELKS
jgi:lipopolysaccharide/colanic/teichoic acid biosynthesis glycosyltransferase